MSNHQISNHGRRPETIAAQLLHATDAATGAVVPPIHLSTTFARDENYENLIPTDYQRGGNPTLWQAEATLAALEQGEACLLYPSGMAAIFQLVETISHGGHVVAPTNMYYAARLWLQKLEAKGRISLSLTGLDMASAIEPGKTELVWIETPSNPMWDVSDIAGVAEIAHRAGAIAVCDAAQLAPHMTMDVQLMGVDFAGITGHKMCGPTGVGVLWGRESLLDAMPPFLGGGDMINDVRIDGFTPNELPWKFEAGTPPIAEVIGLGAACDYLSGLVLDDVRAHEIDLTGYAMNVLEARFGNRLKIHGPRDPNARMGVLSLALEGVHPHDISQVLDQQGVCVRAGHHCAKPLMRRLGVGATARASFYVYNERRDVDTLAEALSSASDFFK